MENFSHVRSGGHGKRRATRKPGCSELHVRPVGCYLEPVAGESGTTRTTTRVVAATVVAVWRVTWQEKGKPRAVRYFRYAQETDARRFAQETKNGAYVELVKTSDPVILASVAKVW